MSPSRRFITMAEYAKAKGVSRNTPYKWADKLEPYFHRDGKKLLLDTELMAEAGLWPVTDGDNLATVSATNEPSGDNLGDNFPADGDSLATESARIEADELQRRQLGDNLGDNLATVSNDDGDNLGDIQKLAIMALRDEIQDLRNEIAALQAEKTDLIKRYEAEKKDLIKRYEAQLASKDRDIESWKEQSKANAVNLHDTIQHLGNGKSKLKKLFEPKELPEPGEISSHGGDHPQAKGEKKSLRAKLLELLGRGNDAV